MSLILKNTTTAVLNRYIVVYNGIKHYNKSDKKQYGLMKTFFNLKEIKYNLLLGIIKMFLYHYFERNKCPFMSLTSISFDEAKKILTTDFILHSVWNHYKFNN